MPKFGLAWLLFFQLFWSCQLAADGHSYFVPECDGVSFHLTKVDGLSARQELVLRVYGSVGDWSIYLPQSEWKDVAGFVCSTDHQCEQATSAKIWTEKTSPESKSVVGKYEVDFRKQHLQGEFVAKLRKQKRDCM
jgi:hypothetical protein